jgi:hypothetical protein
MYAFAMNALTHPGPPGLQEGTAALIFIMSSRMRSDRTWSAAPATVRFLLAGHRRTQFGAWQDYPVTALGAGLLTGSGCRGI